MEIQLGRGNKKDTSERKSSLTATKLKDYRKEEKTSEGKFHVCFQKKKQPKLASFLGLKLNWHLLNFIHICLDSLVRDFLDISYPAQTFHISDFFFFFRTRSSHNQQQQQKKKKSQTTKANICFAKLRFASLECTCSFLCRHSFQFVQTLRSCDGSLGRLERKKKTSKIRLKVLCVISSLS